MDLDDLATSEWGHGQAWDEKVARARARHDQFLALTRKQQIARLREPCDRTCEIPEVRRLALRPLD